MQIRISEHDGVPIYLQIVNQIKYLASAGRLSPGDELPAIRTLAEELVVNPNTVARAWEYWVTRLAKRGGMPAKAKAAPARRAAAKRSGAKKKSTGGKKR